MKASSVEVWLWLLLVMNPHNQKTCELLEHYGSAEELACAIRDESCEMLSNAEKQRARNIRNREVRQILEECSANNIRIVTLDDPEYPFLLKNIYSPPIVLFVRGTLTCLENAISLAVVGPRSPSGYAVHAAEYICSELVKLGTVLVSGLAVGIDTRVHSCSVEYGVPTIGVLACGQLVNYPSENEYLKQRIVDEGGAVISELLPHAGVDSGYFHHRNRMISGLGMGTLVVEASTRSGCLITANHAIEQGRDLFCVPPTDITCERYRGVVPYLRDGAIPTFDYIDVVSEYMYYYLNKINSEAINDRFHRDSAAKKKESKEKAKKSARAEVQAVQENLSEDTQEYQKIPDEPKTLDEQQLDGLSELQVSIARMVEKAPSTIDELIECCEISYPQAAEALTELEIAGIVTLMPDGKYSL